MTTIPSGSYSLRLYRDDRLYARIPRENQVIRVIDDIGPASEQMNKWRVERLDNGLYHIKRTVGVLDAQRTLYWDMPNYAKETDLVTATSTAREWVIEAKEEDGQLLGRIRYYPGPALDFYMIDVKDDNQLGIKVFGTYGHSLDYLPNSQVPYWIFEPNNS